LVQFAKSLGWESGEKTAEGIEEKIGKQVILFKPRGVRDGILL
jgi:hypothetical protein